MHIGAAIMIIFVASMVTLGQWRSVEWSGQPIEMGDTNVQDVEMARANAYAASLALYHQAAISYARQNASFVGTIAAANLVPHLPAQYQQLASWVAVVVAGRDVVTYGPNSADSYRGQNPARIGLALARLAGFSVGAGTAQGAVVASPHRRTSGSTSEYEGAPIPAALAGSLPTGAPVRVSRIP